MEQQLHGSMALSAPGFQSSLKPMYRAQMPATLALGDEKFPIRELCIAGVSGWEIRKFAGHTNTSVAH